MAVGTSANQIKELKNPTHLSSEVKTASTFGSNVPAKPITSEEGSEEVCQSVRKSSHLECRFNYSVDSKWLSKRMKSG